MLLGKKKSAQSNIKQLNHYFLPVNVNRANKYFCNQSAFVLPDLRVSPPSFEISNGNIFFEAIRNHHKRQSKTSIRNEGDLFGQHCAVMENSRIRR